MKVQLVSDLHLEFSDCFDIKNENNADVLILGGDIMLAEKVLKPESEYGIRFRDFLKRMSFQFPHVIYIAGNHEFYGGYFNKSLDNLRAACGVHDNVYFLERDTKIINDVVFVGGTLWTDMNKGDPMTLHAVRDMMNDYRAITHDDNNYAKLKPVDTALRHRDTVAYIKHVVQEHKDKKVVVVGHHTPSYSSCHEMYQHDYIMNGAYHSDLSEIMLDNPHIKLWTHGHTHHCFDYMIGETRVLCNPRGYRQQNNWSEDTGWDPTKVIEV
jgi:DNA repair exonuclease SbcCD nuclease subunit